MTIYNKKAVKQKFLFLVIFFIISLLAGCLSVGPDYVRPDVDHPAEWNSSLAGDIKFSKTKAEDLAEWWLEFNDPVLTGLVKRTVRDNLDIKKAQAKVRQARASRLINRAAHFPTLDATGSGSVSRGIVVVPECLAVAAASGG